MDIDVSGNTAAESRKRKAKALDTDTESDADATPEPNFTVVRRKGRGRPSMYALPIVAPLGTQDIRSALHATRNE